MNNFYFQSKDMYSKYPQKYNYFTDVFEEINKLAVAKHYFNSDQLNIEEILSILEMENYLKGKAKTKIYRRYLADVIKFYTPDIRSMDPLPANFLDFVFGDGLGCKDYGHFLANIFHIIIKENRPPSGAIKKGNLFFSRESNPHVAYSIITLNYDLVFENIIEFINDNYNLERSIEFVNPLKESIQSESINWENVYLAKLHGSVNPLSIVPPIWGKAYSKDLIEVWQLAYNLLKEANHIRILGYSLPISDTYVQYLLKSAVLESQHLKRIDVICLDNDGTVRSRYDNFIRFNYYEFKNENIKSYLLGLTGSTRKKEGNFCFDNLEDTHRDFMESK